MGLGVPGQGPQGHLLEKIDCVGTAPARIRGPLIIWSSSGPDPGFGGGAKGPRHLRANSLLEEGASCLHGGSGVNRVSPVQTSGRATPLPRAHLVMTVPEGTPGIRDPSHLLVACARAHIAPRGGGGPRGCFPVPATTRRALRRGLASPDYRDEAKAAQRCPRRQCRSPSP